MFVPPDDVVAVMDGPVIKSGVAGAEVFLAWQRRIKAGEQVDMPPLVGRKCGQWMSNAGLGINWDRLATARTILRVDKHGQPTFPEGALMFRKDQSLEETDDG